MLKKICIIKANFNQEITDKMLALCLFTLKKHQINPYVINVPGAFEIPQAIKKASLTRNFDAFIAIGCLIKGQTKHFEYISKAVVFGLMKLSIELNRPVAYAVLNCLTEKQAKARIKNIRSITEKMIL